MTNVFYNTTGEGCCTIHIQAFFIPNSDNTICAKRSASSPLHRSKAENEEIVPYTISSFFMVFIV